jgi:ribose/xylose/arabinose/galactoside ABC-type transport system permease subunit
VSAPRRGAGLWRQALGPFIGLALVLAIFTAIGPAGFLSFYNMKTVATQTVIVGLGALGMTFVIVSGGIDLSVGSVIALSSVVTALSIQRGAGELAAFAAGVGAGALCGLVNGTLITRLRLVPFIVTLGMLGIARGSAKYLAGEQKVDAPPSWLTDLMTKSPEPAWLVLPLGVWLLIVLALAAGLVLTRSVLGTYTFAIGSNERTAHLCGVPVAATKVALYGLCGAFAGLAGVMQFGRLTVGDPTTAMGKELDVIAAVVIGGGSLAGGEGRILGSLVGAFLMSTLANGCNLTGVPNYVQEILIGAIIVVAVALDRWRHRGAGADA